MCAVFATAPVSIVILGVSAYPGLSPSFVPPPASMGDDEEPSTTKIVKNTGTKTLMLLKLFKDPHFQRSSPTLTLDTSAWCVAYGQTLTKDLARPSSAQATVTGDRHRRFTENIPALP
ncbi:unnamed protein product [Rhizoctonia solani]|uniref:Secreted protein n=1 Tax=Rhizoctonia solani TaxID=456999 RepID=A0A8H2XCV1_9AGAM|nr:unnamed protein product [Rhizoctonia solani]